MPGKIKEIPLKERSMTLALALKYATNPKQEKFTLTRYQVKKIIQEVNFNPQQEPPGKRRER